MGRRSVFAVSAALAVAVCGVLAAAAGTTSAAVYGSWRITQGVPGTAALNADQFADLTSVSCAAPGDCSAGGYYTDAAYHTQAFVVDQTGGTWGTAREVPGTAALNVGGGARVTSVSCASAGNCAAGGYYTDTSGDTHAFVVDQTGGTWGTAREVPDAAAVEAGGSSQITSVSCASPGNCAAGGDQIAAAHDTGSAFTVDEKDGTWGKARPLPRQRTLSAGKYGVVNSVSCASAGNCAAVGYAGSTAYVADEKNGTWSAPRRVPGTAGYGDDASSVSCASAGNCTVGGFYTPARGRLEKAFVAAETDGTWGKARAVPAPSTNPTAHALLAAVSCASPGNCAAGGDYSVFALFTHRAFVVAKKNGTWGKAQDVPGMLALTGSTGESRITSVSCAAPGDCAAGGYYLGKANHRRAFVVSETDGVWGTAAEVRGLAALNANGSPGITSVSCAAPASCGAVGAYYTDQYQVHSQPLVVNEAPLPATSTTLALSAATVTYGGEQAERASVTVSAASGTPAGKATVRSGASTVCTITLTSGRGSCAMPAVKFAPGAVRLTASYRLSAGFAPSSSAPQTFAVVKAASRTSLTPSAARLRYGREQAERLTVRVFPRYGGTPAGKVTVKSGASTVCVITLRHGAGTCRLAARRLRPGRYRLLARYLGSRDFRNSVSVPRNLTVVR